MRNRLLLNGLLSAVVFTGSAMAQQNLRVYGFMDTQMEVYDMGHPFLRSVLEPHDVNLFMGHANVYFDWQASAQVKALMEVNFLSSKQVTWNTNSTGPAALSYQGNRISDEQFKEMVRPTLEAMVRGQAPTAPDAVVDAVVNGKLDTLGLALTQIRQSTVAPTQNESEKNQVSVERAYFDVNFSDQLNVRVGKFITPAGIWNVDHGSPVVLTVRQPIQTTLTPIFPEAQTGLMVHGRYFLGDHDLEYAMYGSSGRDGFSSDVVSSTYNATDDLSDLALGGHLGVRLDYLDGIRLGTSGMVGTIREKYQVMTPVLDAEQVLPILASGQSPQQIQSALATLKPIDLDYSDEYTIDHVEYVSGLDAKVDWGGATVQGELNYRYRDNQGDGPTKNLETWGMYGLLAYRIPMGMNYSLTPYGMYERVVFTNNGGDIGVLRGFNTYLGGLNFSLYSKVRIKLEWDYFEFLKGHGEGALPVQIKASDLHANIYNVQFSVAF